MIPSNELPDREECNTDIRTPPQTDHGGHWRSFQSSEQTETASGMAIRGGGTWSSLDAERSLIDSPGTSTVQKLQNDDIKSPTAVNGLLPREARLRRMSLTGKAYLVNDGTPSPLAETAVATEAPNARESVPPLSVRYKRPDNTSGYPGVSWVASRTSWGVFFFRYEDGVKVRRAKWFNPNRYGRDREVARQAAISFKKAKDGEFYLQRLNQNQTETSMAASSSMPTSYGHESVKDILCGAPRIKLSAGNDDVDSDHKAISHQVVPSYHEEDKILDDMILRAFYSAIQMSVPTDGNSVILYIEDIIRRVFDPVHSELNLIELAAKINLLVRGYTHHGLTLRVSTSVSGRTS